MLCISENEIKSLAKILNEMMTRNNTSARQFLTFHSYNSTALSDTIVKNYLPTCLPGGRQRMLLNSACAPIVPLYKLLQCPVSSTHLSSGHQLAGAWMSGLISYEGKGEIVSNCCCYLC